MKGVVILQLPVKDDRAFRSYDFITEHFGKVDMEGYKEVWQGLLPDEFTLEDIFEMCNCRHPRGYEGHSMSVSDIVIINGKRWFCNDIGWKEMDK